VRSAVIDLFDISGFDVAGLHERLAPAPAS